MCHLVLAMPIISLPIFYFLPLQAAAQIYSVIFMISLAVYYATAKAMLKPVITGLEAMMGDFAEALEDLRPAGKIKYRNEIWDAYSKTGASKGEVVRIVGFDGIKAVVENNISKDSGKEAAASIWCKLYTRR